MATPCVANPTQGRVGGGWATNAGSRESFHDGDMGWADAPSDGFDRLDAGLSIRNVIYVARTHRLYIDKYSEGIS